MWLMAGARPDRNDLVALTKTAAEITGISYIMNLDKNKADELISKAEKS